MVEPTPTKFFSNRPRFIKRIWNDPFMDWAVILIVAFVLMLVMIGFSAKLFVDVNEQSTAVVATSTPSKATTVPLNMRALVDITNIFQTKASQAPVYNFSYTGPADPVGVTASPKKGVIR